MRFGLYKGKKISTTTLIALLAALFGIIRLSLNLFIGQPSYASDLTLENILSAINRERSLRNLITLNTDSRLSFAAQSKAEDMVARHYFSHTDPEGNYIWPKIVSAGYTPYLQLGENLAIEFLSTESLAAAWMNSPTHRANILNENFKDQGMGLDFGDAQLNQYRSSVANTFGALLIKKQPPSLPPASQQTKQPKPSKTTVAAAATAPPSESKPATSKPATSKPATSTPATTTEAALKETKKLPEPLAIRGSIEGQDFIVTNTSEQASSSNAGLPLMQPKATTAPAVSVLAESGKIYNSLKTNRYLTLGFGIIILLLLLSDLKVSLEKRLPFMDKKINNILLLVLSLIVIAFMYWL